jgi:hypothetical protein
VSLRGAAAVPAERDEAAVFALAPGEQISANVSLKSIEPP